MIYSELTKNAMAIAYQAHKGQLDKAGYPYIAHPIHLAEQMDDEISAAVALLHDVVEDTKLSFNDLYAAGIPENVMIPLKLLTHNQNIDYLTYVSHIKTNEVATKVKIADLKHNSDLTRLNKVTDVDRNRVKKYQRALEILQK